MDQLSAGGVYERSLALWAAAAAGDGPRIEAAIGDPSRAVRALAVRLARRFEVGDEALEEGLLHGAPDHRRALSRLVRRSGRAALADRLMEAVRTERGDGDAARLMVACSGVVVARWAPGTGSCGPQLGTPGGAPPGSGDRPPRPSPGRGAPAPPCRRMAPILHVLERIGRPTTGGAARVGGLVRSARRPATGSGRAGAEPGPPPAPPGGRPPAASRACSGVEPQSPTGYPPREGQRLPPVPLGREPSGPGPSPAGGAARPGRPGGQPAAVAAAGPAERDLCRRRVGHAHLAGVLGCAPDGRRAGRGPPPARAALLPGQPRARPVDQAAPAHRRDARGTRGRGRPLRPRSARPRSRVAGQRHDLLERSRGAGCDPVVLRGWPTSGTTFAWPRSPRCCGCPRPW